jgi:hypothetical protein
LFGHALEQAGQGRGVNANLFLQLRLGQAILHPQARHHGRLSRGEPVIAHPPIHFGGHAASDAGHQEAWIMLEVEWAERLREQLGWLRFMSARLAPNRFTQSFAQMPSFVIRLKVCCAASMWSMCAPG